MIILESKKMKDNLEKMAELIERLSNLNATLLNLTHLDPAIHVKVLREVLPECQQQLKDIYLEFGGEEHD